MDTFVQPVGAVINNNMENQLKQIIAPYLGISAENISNETSLDRNALKSSIYLHRMYSRLSAEGFIINDYSLITKFEDLLRVLSSDKEVKAFQLKAENNTVHAQTGVGIDIEEIASIPLTDNFRDHEFFINNFSSEEIAYCILQQNPNASFAGMFAAKEAIIKADNQLKGSPFNSIIIQHTAHGKPFYKNFYISISHVSTIAVAVAVTNNIKTKDNSPNHFEKIKDGNSIRLTQCIAFWAITLALLALLIVFKFI